jgi:hypothetical protein
MKITLTELIAVNRPRESAALIAEYGIAPAHNAKQVALQLDALVVRYREQFIERLKAIHPHRKLFISESSFCGCGADGQPSEMAPPAKPEEEKPCCKTILTLGIIGLSGLLIGILITKS